MKAKNLKVAALLMLTMGMATTVPMTLTSCGDDEETLKPGGGDNTGNGDQDSTGTGDQDSTGTGDDAILSEAQQKRLLEETAMELMGKVSTRDFEAIQQLASYIDEKVEDTDNKQVQEWYDKAMEACTVMENDEMAKYLYALSSFSGILELKGNKWVSSPAKNKLQFKFNDQSGKPCALTITQSGKTTPVHHESFDDEDWYWEWNGNDYDEWVYLEQHTLVIPEKLEVKLEQNGSTLALATLNTTLNTGDVEFDYTRDKASITAVTQVSPHTITVKRAAFNAGRDAQLEAEWQVSGQKMVSLVAKANGNLGAEKVNEVEYTFDILGKVKMAGTTPDGTLLAQYSDKMDENDEDEAEFKRYMAKFNDLLDVNVYFNGSKRSSASVKMYAFCDRYEWSEGTEEYWYAEPAIYFADGTAYSTVEEFFDEDYYKAVIKKFEQLVDDFNSLFDWDDEYDEPGYPAN